MRLTSVQIEQVIKKPLLSVNEIGMKVIERTEKNTAIIHVFDTDFLINHHDLLYRLAFVKSDFIVECDDYSTMAKAIQAIAYFDNMLEYFEIDKLVNPIEVRILK